MTRCILRPQGLLECNCPNASLLCADARLFAIHLCAHAQDLVLLKHTRKKGALLAKFDTLRVICVSHNAILVLVIFYGHHSLILVAIPFLMPSPSRPIL